MSAVSDKMIMCYYDRLAESNLFIFLLIATDKTKNVDKNSRSPDYSSWMEPIQQQFDLYRSHIDGNNSRSDIWDRNIYGIHHVFYRLAWLLFSTENGILLPKLFWPTVRNNCSSDWEKLLNSRLKAENLQNFWDQ